MGGIFGALGNIGAAYQQAKTLKRQQDIEQSYADIQRQYAQTSAARTQLEYQKLRLEMDPKAQAERDRSYLTNLFGRTPTDDELQRFAKIAPPVKLSGFKVVKMDNSPTGWGYEAIDENTGAKIQQLGAPAPPSGRLTKGPLVPDPSSVTGVSQVMLDAQGNPVKHVPNVFVPGMQTRITEGWTKTTDADGNEILVPTVTETRREMPQIPGVTPPPGASPAAPGDQRQRQVIGHKPTAAAKSRPEIQTGLDVLHAALWGAGGTPGLSSTIGVLDSKASRAKLINAGVGRMATTTSGGLMSLPSEYFQAYASNLLSDDELAFKDQFNRALGAINSLREITGLPRSTQAQMNQYAKELPNPITTPNSKDAKRQMELIEREINVAMQRLGGTTPSSGAGATGLERPLGSGATDHPAPPPAAMDPAVKQYLKSKGVPVPD